MTDRSNQWAAIFGQLVTDGHYEMGEVNLYKLTTILENLSSRVAALEPPPPEPDQNRRICDFTIEKFLEIAQSSDMTPEEFIDLMQGARFLIEIFTDDQPSND